MTARGLIAVCAVVVAPIGVGTADDTSAAFEPLFDGKTLDGWRTIDGKPPTQAWEVADGAIHHRKGRGGHIVSTRTFTDFELRFDWKIAAGGNSGVKYRMTKTPRGLYGCEYQLLDDDRHPNGKNPKTRLAALYDLYAPDETAKAVKPVGQYNESRIVAAGTRLEHWLNGKKVLSVDTASDDWKAKIGRSKFRTIDGFAAARPSPIMLQDHGDDVWFRNIVIRPTAPAAREESSP